MKILQCNWINRYTYCIYIAYLTCCFNLSTITYYWEEGLLFFSKSLRLIKHPFTSYSETFGFIIFKISSHYLSLRIFFSGWRFFVRECFKVWLLISVLLVFTPVRALLCFAWAVQSLLLETLFVNFDVFIFLPLPIPTNIYHYITYLTSICTYHYQKVSLRQTDIPLIRQHHVMMNQNLLEHAHNVLGNISERLELKIKLDFKL